jgi:group I intron endonuclease
MTKIGKIYKIKNLTNEKEYIGCTISTLKKRFEEHIFRCLKSDSNTKLCNSIRKYGFENFRIELIDECDTSIIYEKEKYFINEMNTFKKGLNSTYGGEGCLGYTHNEEIRKKISKIIKDGKSHKDKTYEMIYGERSEEEKKIRKESVKKNWENMTDEDRKKRSEKIRNSKQKKSKYKIELITELKNKLKSGIGVSQLAKEYPNVNIYTIYDIKNNRRWKNI